MSEHFGWMMATIKAIEASSVSDFIVNHLRHDDDATDTHGQVHQIQSGQVIVDLCSVAKELVENGLDAGATSIGRIDQVHTHLNKQKLLTVTIRSSKRSALRIRASTRLKSRTMVPESLQTTTRLLP